MEVMGEKLIVYGGYFLCSISVLSLLYLKAKKERIMVLSVILAGVLIIVIGNNMLDTKKDYISKIESLIEANTPIEKEQKEEFIKDLEKTNIFILESIYKDLKRRNYGKEI